MISLATYPQTNFQDAYLTIFDILPENLQKILNTEEWEHLTVNEFLETYTWDTASLIYLTAKSFDYICSEKIVKRQDIQVCETKRDI